MSRKTLWIIGGSIAGLLLAALAVYVVVFMPPDWRSGVDEAAKGTEDGLYPWIGARKPVLVIHEYLDFDCPFCSIGHKAIRSRIARHYDKVRLVRHDYARMPCAPNSAQKKYRTCELVRAAICASAHMDYWAWNDAVIEAPRARQKGAADGYVPAMRDRMKLPAAQFDRCLYDDATIAKAQKIYEETKKAGVRATPTYMVNGRKLRHHELVELLNDL